MKEWSIFIEDFPGSGWYFGGIAGDWGSDDFVVGNSSGFAAVDGVDGELSADEGAQDEEGHD